MYIVNPILRATPGEPLSYNPSMAETFSWVPVENDGGRPFFAQGSYCTNVEDFKIQLSAVNINYDLDHILINTYSLIELVDTLTAITQHEFDETQELLDTLTSITQHEFDETQELLDALTAITQVEFN